MLEVNIYDNFNPNYYNIKDFNLPNGQKAQRGLPKPKARCVAMSYELWETGYLYTSTATLSYPVEVGDIVQVLFPETVPIETGTGVKQKLNLDMVYLVTSVDENNTAVLENYFWAMIKGIDIPNYKTKSTNFAIIDYLIDPSRTSLMTYGYFFNSTIFAGKATINRKAETSEATDVAKRVFSRVQFQPTSTIQYASFGADPMLTDPRTLIFINFASRDWNRKRVTTRIDYQQNVTTETETVIERSEYNFAIVFVKNATTEDYTDAPKMYTVKDNGDVVDYSTYNGDGTDLPAQRIVKTLFYDEEPALSTIKAEVSPSTIVKRLIFDQNELLPLYTNDLVDIWYEGTLYSGYIADRVKTEAGDRLVFVEGSR